MAKITVDGQTHDVKAGENLLKTCLSLGLDLPYFCWHPALGSVGACRQCAVVQYKDESDTRGRLVMACMTPVAEGLRVSLEAPEAREFRAGVIECLMTNHPHDCPVCEEGGECHLQDMTVMTGHTFRRYRGLKRTHRNQYLGPFINHEMNRCIACYRCVRLYRDYAGGKDLDVFASRNRVYFGRFEDGVLENEFSGNLVEVCPTGVFTDRPFSRHYVRKWDLQHAPSVCVHCGVGCNTSPGERYGTLRRIVNRYHGEVNGYFLCDRGRFGYGFVNSERRIRQPLLHGDTITAETALAHFRSLIGGHMIGIGSPRASLEANFALRELVGAANFYAGLSQGEAALAAAVLEVLRHWPVRVPSLREVEQADAVLIVGEDVANTAPRLALALRQAVRNRAFERADRLKIPRWQDAAVREAAQDEKSPLFVLASGATRLDDIAESVLPGTPEDIARLGMAVARRIDPNAPAVPDLSEADAHLAECIAGTLGSAARPLIVSGTGCGSLAVVRAAANIAHALANRRGGSASDLCYVVPECNTLGLAMMDGRSVMDAFAAAKAGDLDTVIVLENDLYRRTDGGAVDSFFNGTRHVVVIDHIRHGTAAKAQLLLPGSTFAETEGTLVSLEGRAQRFYSVMPGGGEICDSWRWLSDAAGARWLSVDGLTAVCAASLSGFGPIRDAAPPAGFRIEGEKIPRQPHRYSGRTAMNAHRDIHEPRPPDDPDSALAFSMEGANVDVPPALLPFAWAPRWNSHQQAVNKFQDEVGGSLRSGDPGVRLFETPETPEPRWFDEVPSPSRDRTRWRAIPLYHVFGSEELSALSPSLTERVPAAYAALHPDDANKLGVAETLAVRLNERLVRLPLRLEASLPRGAVGISVSLPGLYRSDFPAWVAIETEGDRP
ncbi:NADH-quinone oxidoreductase subunit G [Methylocaldum marinum]|uniref:NADH-quinone oxidoreductase n=1 Tax=Methylocaldum marinum TaxID=1432792 RepID=A0A250KXK1_9GAMM|nr:NADH-quinone oxidoreductase subunit NuoG [Methylocaldum marinum]BBA36355.1 NADH-quinone oxidoreductase subunit G [Methylocaldum marinum]